MSTLIGTLREEHRNMALLLDALERQVWTFAQSGAPDYELIIGIADYFLGYPDLCHHPKEDVVFEQLRAAVPQEASRIGDLLAEHRTVHERVQHFRSIIGAVLQDSEVARSDVVETVREFVNAERTHMRLEEERFFPLAEMALTPADWSVIERTLKARQEATYEDGIDEAFDNLREALISWERDSETG